MKSLKFIFFLIVSTTLLNGCRTLTPFQPSIPTEYGLNDSDLHNIQFYVSGQITLRRENTKYSDSLRVYRGELLTRIEEGRETIIIKRHAPCIFVGSVKDQDVYTVEAEEGNKLFFFINKNDSKCFLAADWGNNNTGKLQYGGEIYETNDYDVFLMVKSKVMHRIENKYRVVRGMKLKGK